MLGPDTLLPYLGFDNYCGSSEEEMFGLALEYVKENERVNSILLLRKAGDMFTVSICCSKRW